MLRYFLHFLIILAWTHFISGEETKLTRSLKINIISDRNGRGLQADQDVLKREIEALGHIVTCLNVRKSDKDGHNADINIFFQEIDPFYIDRASLNWLIPNPEWYSQSIEFLENIDLILCRTKEVERIFGELDKSTYYLGFTSRDCLDSAIPKDYTKFVHLAGYSVQKGTPGIVEAWRKHAQFPLITILQFNEFTPEKKLKNLRWIDKRVADVEMCKLQNEAGIHLCLSETEGFGHYLMEALSCEAIVITTDAPPMNEFIQDPRFLVPYLSQGPLNLATNYYMDSTALAQTIMGVMNLSLEERAAIGKNNRQKFLTKTKQFRANLQRLLKDRRLTTAH